VHVVAVRSFPCPLESYLPHLAGAWRTRFATAAPGGARLSDQELFEAAAAVKTLSRGLTRDRELAGSFYMEDPRLLGGYLLFYWPVSYAQTWAALLSAGLAPGLAEVRGANDRRPAVRRALDIGSGPGPAAFALLDAGCPEVTALDRSPAALELLADVARRAGRRLDTQVLDVASAGAPAGRYELITAVHLMNELWPDRLDRIDLRRKLLQRLSGVLAPGGRILVVDPALTATANDAIALRDALTGLGWRVHAPCTRTEPCPALPEGTCHAEVAWDPPAPVIRLAHAARIGREELDFSYFLLEPPEPGARPAASVRLPAAADGAGDAPAASAGDAPALWRVVSDRFLAKSGRLRFLVCGPEGRIPFSMDGKAHWPVARTFRALRRGDLVRIAEAERRATGLGLAETTVLQIVSRTPELSCRTPEAARNPAPRRPAGRPVPRGPHAPRPGQHRVFRRKDRHGR
jgi:SAM-dependent methyltransferase